MPPVGFEPTISAGERPQAAHLLRSPCSCSDELVQAAGIGGEDFGVLQLDVMVFVE
jgi:hypothetical protein